MFTKQTARLPLAVSLVCPLRWLTSQQMRTDPCQRFQPRWGFVPDYRIEQPEVTRKNQIDGQQRYYNEAQHPCTGRQQTPRAIGTQTKLPQPILDRIPVFFEEPAALIEYCPPKRPRQHKSGGKETQQGQHQPGPDQSLDTVGPGFPALLQCIGKQVL